MGFSWGRSLDARRAQILGTSGGSTRGGWVEARVGERAKPLRTGAGYAIRRRSIVSGKAPAQFIEDGSMCQARLLVQIFK